MFALAVVGLVEDLPRGRTAEVIGKQLLRAGTSVGANYRSACRARSREEAGQLVAIVVSSIRTARRTPIAIPHSAFRVRR